MKVEQIYTGCLAQGAYYIESNGEAAIIDPLREVAPYIAKAEKEGAKIKYVLETHFHADFVSGHVDLAKKTGATIVYGPTAETGFESHIAKDNEELKLGNVTIRVLHTPGHTMESSSYLLIDENGKYHSIFSGDTLFIGDVGRPDLAVKSDLSKEDLAGLLYDSLRNKVMPLPDELIIYPAHGAGSACGKNMSKETWDTLGHQKEVNYALRDISKEQFIKEVLDGIAPPPQYFPKNALMNKKGYDSIDSVLSHGARSLDPAEFEVVAEAEEALVLDTRKPTDFSKGYVPNSINIGLDGQFAAWVGALITDLKQPILLITDIGREEEAVTRLARVGYDNTIGHLNGGFDAWKASGKDIETIKSITADEFSNIFKKDETIVLDVRRESEYRAEHVEESFNKPLDFINDWMSTIDHKTHYYIHCAGGYRSMITASILKARGFNNFTEVAGGFGAIAKTNVPKTDFVCQSKLQG
ncbi:MBL fold metallo-hydrolase [Solitalea canadensis]|uniref:Zn-dependent hydrolase, glyoxylase n=1 Tax=Solitalea canadensis (strain ATCC 29591 / DSM 3403 / JCM 21819 / LMG 8368 / NBRC 15130 / NCIMB 12057 / USAM 9D) TaxID=929556 RepID=H8KXD6_SOLCM|nr:MBL fold metallo-hydrolase [Solitalea canadensis]AFD08465.1 Zn-dependent hydrolase, glyoxylase [Solitalea canadensis DSM 3403]